MAIWTAGERVAGGGGAVVGSEGVIAGAEGAEDEVGVAEVDGADGVAGVAGVGGTVELDPGADVSFAAGVACDEDTDVCDVGGVAIADGSAAGTMARSWPNGRGP
ncbi:MAG TPA: hypothetical protein VJQ83_09555 [Tepidiformaceae bacterium]|nr:hypothetical protein [Tepidiformaceae bacterium]